MSRRTTHSAGARIGALMALALSWSCLTAVTAEAQSLLDRSPLLSGGWVGIPGTVYFNFVHRFTESGAPEHKVTNVPTFLLGTPLPEYLFVGINYATNSQLATQFPNEHEYFLRAGPLAQHRGAPVDLSLQAGYNDAARGADGELSVARRIGPVRLLSAARVLSNPLDTGGVKYAVLGGATIRLGQYIALAGDAGGLTKRAPGERLVWSAGVHLQLPLTPHTLSLQATNVNSATIQGSSRGTSETRYGFEFTIPFTVRRYFGPRAAPPTPSAPPSAAANGRATSVHIKDLGFHPTQIEVPVGTTVEWVNDDPLQHTATAIDGDFRSPLIEPGTSWRYTFTKAGTYAFYCTPHPFMKGVVVVR
jgi:plastocyanin